MIKKYVDINDVDDLAFSEFGHWNDENVAFIKQAECDGKIMWSIYGADGIKIAMTDNREFAFLVARQNDLDPKSVH